MSNKSIEKMGPYKRTIMSHPKSESEIVVDEIGIPTSPNIKMVVAH